MKRPPLHKVGAALLLALAATPALAQRPLLGIEITPFAGYRTGGRFRSDNPAPPADGRLEIREGTSAGVILDLRADANTQWEVLYSQQPTQLQARGTSGPAPPPQHVGVTYWQIGGTYVFDGTGEGPSAWAHPFVAATVGASRFDPGLPGFDGDNFFAFSLGGGYRLAPTSRLGLRLEARVFGNVVDSDSALFCRLGGPQSGCLIAAHGDVVWQWEFIAGLTARF